MAAASEGWHYRFQPSCRTRDHDRSSVAVRQQSWKRGFDGEIGPTEQYVDRVDVGANLVRRLSERRSDPCVGEDEVQAAQFSYAFVHNDFELSKSRTSACAGTTPTPGLLNKVNCFVKIRRRCHRIRHAIDLVTQVDCDYVGALFGEPDGVGATLARAAPVISATLPWNCVGTGQCPFNHLEAATWIVTA